MLDDRFWTKVKVSTDSECWEWQANKNNKGYGLFRPGGTREKQLAHRLSFQAANGSIPTGTVIRHSCDNPACVNPAHLSAGTQKQNMEDAAWKERICNTRLTAAQVISLLKEYVSGVPRKEICERYGLRESSLSSYTGGEAWSHLHGKQGCPTLEELTAAKRRKPGAKINLQIANEIRRRLAAGELGVRLAAEYGLNKATISEIKLGKIWNGL